MKRSSQLFFTLLIGIDKLVESAAPLLAVELYDLQYSYYTKFQNLIDAEENPMQVSSLLTINDIDSTNLSGATIEFTSGYVAGDVLLFVDQNSITGSFNSVTGTMSFSGVSSISDYENALRSVTYKSSRDHEFTDQGNSHTKVLRFQVVDDSAENSNQVTRNIILTTPKMVYTDTHQGKIIRITA